MVVVVYANRGHIFLVIVRKVDPVPYYTIRRFPVLYYTILYCTLHHWMQPPPPPKTKKISHRTAHECL